MPQASINKIIGRETEDLVLKAEGLRSERRRRFLRKCDDAVIGVVCFVKDVVGGQWWGHTGYIIDVCLAAVNRTG
jgi:hypothetical protein